MRMQLLRHLSSACGDRFVPVGANGRRWMCSRHFQVGITRAETAAENRTMCRRLFVIESQAVAHRLQR